MRVRRAHGRTVNALLAYSLDRFGNAFVAHAWSDFFRDPHDEASEPPWPASS